MDSFDYKGYLKSGKLFEENDQHIEKEKKWASETLNSPEFLDSIIGYNIIPSDTLKLIIDTLSGDLYSEDLEMARKAVETDDKGDIYAALSKIMNKYKSILSNELKKEMTKETRSYLSAEELFWGEDMDKYKSEIDDFVSSNYDEYFNTILKTAKEEAGA